MKKRYKFFPITISFLIIITGYFFISQWYSNRPVIHYQINTENNPVPAYPDASFAVISDLHMYDVSLGIDGSAFESVLHSDRKLLRESGALIDFAIEEILRANIIGTDTGGIQFVLISGDMTKDSERINHEVLTANLSRLTNAGIKVYVTPGNHDVNILSNAVSFSGGRKIPVETVNQEEFASLYHDFGYGDALYRDTDSLSYIAEPVSGLWLLSIDACQYKENIAGEDERVDGAVSQQTADWIADVLQKAQEQNKAVIAFMHHGVVEHWKGQSRLHPDYLIKEFNHFGRMLASYGVRLVFTGHYHAQDITLSEFKEGYIYDIQTGSLITAPCPIRYVTLESNLSPRNKVTITSDFIVDKIYPGTDFAENAAAFVKETVMREAFSTLKNNNVNDADADRIAAAVGEAFAAHYAGDENPALRPPLEKNKLSLFGRIALLTQGYALDGLWRDLPPADNNVSFYLD